MVARLGVTWSPCVLWLTPSKMWLITIAMTEVMTANLRSETFIRVAGRLEQKVTGDVVSLLVYFWGGYTAYESAWEQKGFIAQRSG